MKALRWSGDTILTARGQGKGMPRILIPDAVLFPPGEDEFPKYPENYPVINNLLTSIHPVELGRTLCVAHLLESSTTVREK